MQPLSSAGRWLSDTAHGVMARSSEFGSNVDSRLPGRPAHYAGVALLLIIISPLDDVLIGGLLFAPTVGLAIGIVIGGWWLFTRTDAGKSAARRATSSLPGRGEGGRYSTRSRGDT